MDSHLVGILHNFTIQQFFLSAFLQNFFLRQDHMSPHWTGRVGEVVQVAMFQIQVETDA